MYRRSFLFLAALFLTPLPNLTVSPVLADGTYRISGPVKFENLTIYFLHGASSTSAVPLTLADALTAKLVRVYETGSVNELAIENLADNEVFVQSGDIVKGGQQDRVLSVSLVLPPHSGKLQIEAFCVEQGRWSKRGYEDDRQFSSATTAVPSRDAKLAIHGAQAQGLVGHGAQVQGLMGSILGANPNSYADVPSVRQYEVWDEVARIQELLSKQIGTPVTSAQSESSLQLALENEKLKERQKSYITALESAGEKKADIVGYAFAVNGKLNSAEVYQSNALFRKMWSKLLSANVTEAIAAKADSSEKVPSITTVTAFLKSAENGTPRKRALTQFVELEIRDSDKTVYLETRRPNGSWVHRSYLAK